AGQTAPPGSPVPGAVRGAAGRVAVAAGVGASVVTPGADPAGRFKASPVRYPRGGRAGADLSRAGGPPGARPAVVRSPATGAGWPGGVPGPGGRHGSRLPGSHPEVAAPRALLPGRVVVRRSGGVRDGPAIARRERDGGVPRSVRYQVRRNRGPLLGK